MNLIMKIFWFDFNRLNGFFLWFQFFTMLNELISLTLKLLDNFFIICNFAKKFTINSFFVEIFADKHLSICYTLNNMTITVAVLISLKANSTVLNFYISLSILFLNILLTKVWVKKIFLHCFSLWSLSWIALSAISTN